MPINPRVAVYTGSFDPFHFGHDDIVRRACKLFDSVVVGVGVNPEKQPLFSIESLRCSPICRTSESPPSKG
jgi:pantetheine-phosphate adenylyltransferase